MAYIGRSPEYGNAVSQQITGTNSAGPYTLSYDSSTSGVVISLDGVVQRNSVDFNIAGTALTFTSTVGTGIIINVVFTGLTLSFPTPSDGSVTDAKIVDMAASKLTGALPAISGANLTSLPSDITKSTSEPTATTNPSGGVGTVYLRTTTGEMYCCTDATTNANVWKNIGDGTGLQPFDPTTATGGTITTEGNYKVHTFTSSGTFAVSAAGQSVEYLVVAGGGGGGIDSSGWGGGGGGAGGYRTATGFGVTATSYSITVGAGGSMDTAGSDSVFATITSDGGGEGGAGNGDNGGNGGSGGGGAGGSGGSGAGGVATTGQGNNGGAGSNTVSDQSGGGGGGAGAAGEGESNKHNLGGDGLQNDITGTNTYYAGGGGAGASSTGGGDPTNAGGQGGGGTGSSRSASVNATAGGANLGGGGGGGAYSTSATSGSGGSGVVILRYKFQSQ